MDQRSTGAVPPRCRCRYWMLTDASKPCHAPSSHLLPCFERSLPAILSRDALSNFALQSALVLGIEAAAVVSRGYGDVSGTNKALQEVCICYGARAPVKSRLVFAGWMESLLEPQSRENQAAQTLPPFTPMNTNTSNSRPISVRFGLVRARTRRTKTRRTETTSPW